MIRRMASIKVTRSDLFPSGTTVKAFLTSGFHKSQSQEGRPAGVEAGSAAMSGSPPEATISGLIAGSNYTLWANVAGVDQYMLVQAPEEAPSTAATGIPTPQSHKLLGWAFDPVAAANQERAIVTAGLLHFVKVYVPEQCSISKIVMWLSKKGATLTASQCFVGLYQEGTRKLLGKVPAATVIAAWEGTDKQEIQLALEQAVAVGPGYVLVGFFYNGTTAPQFAAQAVSANSGGVDNVGVSGTNSRFGTGDSGLTTALPDPITAAAAAEAGCIWAGVV